MTWARCRRSVLEVPAPYGRNIAPNRACYLRGCLIGESQERVARTKPLTGDVRVSPTTRIPLLLVQRLVSQLQSVQRYEYRDLLIDDLVNGSLGHEIEKVPELRLSCTLWTCETSLWYQEKGARSKTTQGEGMRSTRSSI